MYVHRHCARVILSELLLMIQVLQPGGHFVCKLFDSFCDVTASVIFTVSQMFEDTYIVKPERSRVGNSERYLVGKCRKVGSVTGSVSSSPSPQFPPPAVLARLQQVLFVLRHSRTE